MPGLVRLYADVCGVTGTARSSADEFRRLYGLEVVVVASDPGFRRFLGSRVYPSVEDQLDAVVDEVKYCWSSGRPALVSCRTVEMSLLISRRLEAEGIVHGLLNARTVVGEVSVVERRGRFGRLRWPPTWRVVGPTWSCRRASMTECWRASSRC